MLSPIFGLKTDLTTVEQVYQTKEDYGFLQEGATIREFNAMIKQTAMCVSLL